MDVHEEPDELESIRGNFRKDRFQRIAKQHDERDSISSASSAIMARKITDPSAKSSRQNLESAFISRWTMFHAQYIDGTAGPASECPTADIGVAV